MANKIGWRAVSRRTKAQMTAIREGIIQELRADNPQTIRGLFYRLVSRGLIAKTEPEYKGTVVRLATEMRRSGEVPYGWIADQTRMMRRRQSFSSAEEALRRTAQTYRRALWDDAATVPEIWCEKDAITGVLIEETWDWDVPLMPCRGYPSVTFLHAAAEAIYDRHENCQHTFLYYFGDHDPSGTDIDRFVINGIGESLIALGGYAFDDFEPEEAFYDAADFMRVAVTPSQIKSLNLQTRPTKRNPRDYRAKKFVGDSVEVDAIPARTLRAIAANCIERHVDQHELEVLRTVEAEERRGLLALAQSWGAA
jgi:hypothetical protein